MYQSDKGGRRRRAVSETRPGDPSMPSDDAANQSPAAGTVVARNCVAHGLGGHIEFPMRPPSITHPPSAPRGVGVPFLARPRPLPVFPKRRPLSPPKAPAPLAPRLNPYFLTLLDITLASCFPPVRLRDQTKHRHSHLKNKKSTDLKPPSILNFCTTQIDRFSNRNFTRTTFAIQKRRISYPSPCLSRATTSRDLLPLKEDTPKGSCPPLALQWQ